MAKQLLNQVYGMQLAYCEQNYNYCLNGASTHAGDSTFYPLLGIVPELSDCYTYTITTDDHFDFSCIAIANIDEDTANDIWRISNLAPDRGRLVCISNDANFLFQPNTKYYWQVIAKDDHGNSTVGPVWHFTTSSDTTGLNNFPYAPQLLTPVNGATVFPDTAIFTWNCSDPDGDSLTYDLFIGTSMEGLQYPHFRSISRTYQPSAWHMRVKLKEFLGQIYTLQSAYHEQHGSYCLNGTVASYGYDNFASLGAIVDSLNRYTYTMNASTTTFCCTATANLDDDATVDTWTINQDSTMDCTIDDFNYFRPPFGVYYWRVSATDDHGHTTLSPIWSFSTSGP